MYLFFDTETTGLPISYYATLDDLKNWPRLVQIAWLHYDYEGNKVSENSYIIKPQGFIIPESALKIHGITTEKATNEGTDLCRVLNQFAQVIKESDLVVAHNMNFDEKIVGAEFLRMNIPHNLFEIRRICTMIASTNFCKLPGINGYKYPSLSELYRILFGIGFREVHDATKDVLACAECFFELKKREIIK